MAKLYWKIKVDGKWGWWAHENYTDIHLQCECQRCRLQLKGGKQ